MTRNFFRFTLLICSLTSFLYSEFVYDTETFIDKLAHDSFKYFSDLYDDRLGLIPDSSRSDSPCSIAAVGFGLVAFCIGAERNWIDKNKSYEKIKKTLKSFLTKVEHKNGFFYHFVDMYTGKRVWDSEVSSIDTALFLAGAIVASQYFKGTEIETLVEKIYDRIDWNWMLNGRKVFCMGWKPEEGFLEHYWNTYSEHIVLYALGIGANRGVEVDCWYQWRRPKASFGGYSYIYCPTGSLFTYQYSHAFIDFRNLKDKQGDIDYWQNSINATLANKKFCEMRKDKYKTYREGFWGLTACIGPDGYKGYGGGTGWVYHDGTVAPSAAAGSMVFLPEECKNMLMLLYEKYKSKTYCEYGFVNSFNLDRNWFADECLGIDTGITLLMIENYRSGFVWKYFMNHPAIKKFLNLCFYKN